MNGSEPDLGYLYVVVWTLFGLMLDELHRFIERTSLRKQTLEITHFLQKLLMVAPEDE